MTCSAILTTCLTPSSFALDSIIRPYMSARAAGMGNVRYTTGLYDENFYGNPARVTANPNWRVQLPEFMVETTFPTLSNISQLISSATDANSSALYNTLGDLAGKEMHARVQTVFPAAYLLLGEKKQWGLAFGILQSTQVDAEVGRNYQFTPQLVSDIGPSVTLGRKFLENDALSIGLTTRFAYRVSARNTFQFSDILTGSSLSLTNLLGHGGNFDFDLGATYDLPWKVEEVGFTVAMTVNNWMNGPYSHVRLPIGALTAAPITQPRTLSLGGVARRAQLWHFSDISLALEFTDIGNNINGSFFRLFHMGTEWHLFDGKLALRTGINQGYICGGIGVDFKWFSLDFSTIGEELTLTAGGRQSRNQLLRIAFQI